MEAKSTNDIYQKLREPFESKFISWRVTARSKDSTKAQIAYYIDARAVQHRLNTVLGVDGWNFTYKESEKDNSVHGRLEVRVGKEIVVREDVGYPNSEDKQEMLKDAVSDALKRCAVHFGVGHFLYALPMLWINWNGPEQRYLTNDQNDFCRGWLENMLKRISEQSESTSTK